MAESYVVNGKFLRAQSTGVHRVAHELANALAALKEEGHPSLADMDFAIWLPGDGEQRAQDIHLSRRVIRPLTGIPWEQLILPFRQGSATLLNLCNIGPVASRASVTMIHDVQVHLSPSSYRRSFRLWYHAVQPLLARRHRLILTVSAFSKEQIARVGLCPPEKIAVVHNGADHILREAADRAVNERLALARHRYVVAMSTVQAHKNIRVLLEAFADPRLSGVKLVLAGSDGRSAFEAQGWAVPANAVFAGRVSDAQLRALMEDALCLAFPSTTEGFGLPPLEAMTVGCPAVVAPCGALPEVCGDAAVYAPADDATSWSAALAGLADSPGRRVALSAAGLRHAERFTWRRAALTLAAALNSHRRTNS